jgi:serine/threonine protein kinase
MVQYHLTDLIGVGTFAEVWRAERLDHEGRPCAGPVALKIGFYAISDERSNRERAILYRTAPLQHPGTIRILDITARDRLLVAMELAEGTLLSAQLRHPSIPECVRHLVEVASSLDDLHGRHVIHGGINPTDILICAGHAKIADFGPFHTDSATSKIPYYKTVCMAPELRQGEAIPESDQYALAATYAWLRLQGGAFPLPVRAELPSEIALARLPRAECDVLSIACNRQPHQRFASCSAFMAALQQVLR